MNYDFIYSLASEVVFIESKNIDLNKQGIKIKTTELEYKRKKDDELRKVFKLKAHNLIQESRTRQHPHAISFCQVLVVHSKKWAYLLKNEKNASIIVKKRIQLLISFSKYPFLF